MRPIGWLLTCLLFTSAIFARVFPKKGDPVERKNALAIPTFTALQNKTSDAAAAAAAAAFLPSMTHLSELLEFNWNTSLVARQVEKDGKEEGLAGVGDARTFGHKRIQFMLMPLMYKMGVMMTLLTVLTIISLKGLLIGAILLILKLSTIVGKFTSGWSSYAHHPPAASPPSHGWSSPSNQPIHLHLHNSFPHGHSNNPYHGHHAWIPPSELESAEPFDRSHLGHYFYKG